MSAASVLIVDDDPVSRIIVEDTLGPLGFVTDSVESAHEALHRLRTQPLPDVVVSDVSMPGMSGFEFCDTIRGEASLRHLPLVFITAFGDREARLEALGLGADDLLAKPIDLTELVVRVRAMAQLSHYRVQEGRRQRLDEVLGRIGQGVALVGADGRLVRANERARQLLGLDAERSTTDPDLHAHLASVGMVPVDAPSLDLSADTPQRVTYMRPGEGTTSSRYIDLACAPLDRDAGPAVSVLTVDDSTAARLGQSSADIVIDAINHKFRTPLTGVLSALALLDRSDLEPTAASLVTIARRGADRLGTTITRIVEYASARASDRPAKPVHLEPSTAQEALRARIADGGAGVTVDVDLPAAISVRDDALTTAVEELTANALEVASSPAGVHLHAVTDGRWLEVTVTDDGPGFPTADEALIFDQFHQVDVTANGEGIGLGLPLVRALVEDAGGSAWASSRSGAPTRFGFRLPLLAGEVPS